MYKIKFSMVFAIVTFLTMNFFFTMHLTSKIKNCIDTRYKKCSKLNKKKSKFKINWTKK